ncbi:hypothetical protein PR048_025565 [Dryococelus australis]|uniref:DUF4817 domain-containing protein n=1 Tax=Dryococelus australis TaxID=614101 RepID=A0ABQ9GRN7_9NEOP|nr:hypothetical protein PR048_025565 [Dryococelus australis]
MVFSQEQRVFIVEHYFATHSYARVADEFCLLYPDTAVPNNATITKLINYFGENGSVADKKRSGRLAFLVGAKLADVERIVLRSPLKSLRRLSAQVGISYGSAQQAMKKLHLRAYHVRCVQVRKGPDQDKRLLEKVFFTDEAGFHLSGYVNSQNSTILSSANPHVLHEKPLLYQKIGSVVCCVTSPNMNCTKTLLLSLLHFLTLMNCDFWFQQDSTTCHTLNATMQFLLKFFGDRLISAGLWPPRSPDLSPPDFFLWDT